MNERFIFIPSIAFSLVSAWVLVKHGFESQKQWAKYLAGAILIILIFGYAFKTYDRIPAWKNALSLNGQAAVVSENSARANSFMATALFELGRDTSDYTAKKQLFDEAEFYAKRAIEIYPQYNAANQIYAGLVAERYQRDNNQQYLFDEFAKILDRRPDTEYVYQFSEYLNRQLPPQTMADFYYRVAHDIMMVKNQQYPRAVQYLKLAETIAPNDARILHALGTALYRGGDQVQGTQYLERAYQLNPALRTQ